MRKTKELEQRINKLEEKYENFKEKIEKTQLEKYIDKINNKLSKNYKIYIDEQQHLIFFGYKIEVVLCLEYKDCLIKELIKADNYETLKNKIETDKYFKAKLDYEIKEHSELLEKK